MFPLAQTCVSNVVLVSDEAIVDAQRALWSTLRLVVEPGGAAAFAALLSRAYGAQPGESIGVILCGANTGAVDFSLPRGSARAF
jgi:threonine dehydratase